MRDLRKRNSTLPGGRKASELGEQLPGRLVQLLRATLIPLSQECSGLCEVDRRGMWTPGRRGPFAAD